MLFNTVNKGMIYSGEHDFIRLWSEKWGVSQKQINDAILDTGTINAVEIKNYLKKRGILFSVFGLIKYFGTVMHR
ncbi:MAG: hypothetical protein V4608_01760 [Bacteroidota bacterium]